MADRSKDESDHLNLIEQIKQAFCGIPYPGDDRIVGTPEHVAVCEECRNLREIFAGRHWTELLGENEIDFETLGALSLLSPAGWQYYLPAYLIPTIQQQSYNSIYLKPGDHLEERLWLLSIDQFKALAAYMLIVLKAESASRLSYKTYKKLLNYWKSMYKNIVGQDLDTDQ